MKKYVVFAVLIVALALIVIPALAYGGFGMGRGGGQGGWQSAEDHAQWLDQQVQDGVLTRQQADYMKQMYDWHQNGVSEEEYAVWINQQVSDGWLTPKQADAMKEQFQRNRETYGENAPVRGMGPGYMSGSGRFGRYCGTGRGGMMNGRW